MSYEGHFESPAHSPTTLHHFLILKHPKAPNFFNPVLTAGRTSWEWTFFPNLSQSFAVRYQNFLIEICGKYKDNNLPFLAGLQSNSGLWIDDVRLSVCPSVRLSVCQHFG